MHRPGRIGRDVFDIDLLRRADRALAVGRALAQHGAQFIGPGRRLQGQIDEAGSGDVDRGDQRVSAQFFGDLLGKIARLGLGLLGKHHGGVGRHVAMRGIARRLDHDAGEIDAGRPAAFAGERRADGVHARKHGRQTGAGMVRFVGHDGRRLTQIRGRVKKPLVLDQGEAVGHPGDEIADPPRALGVDFLPRSLAAIRPAGRRGDDW